MKKKSENKVADDSGPGPRKPASENEGKNEPPKEGGPNGPGQFAGPGPGQGPGPGPGDSLIRPGDLNLDRLVSDVRNTMPPPPVSSVPVFNLPPPTLPPPRSDLIDNTLQIVNSSATLRVIVNIVPQ